MDSFDVKMEKKKAMLRYRQMRRVAGSLRLIEIAVILVMISKLTLQFPTAIKSSSVYFRDLSVVLVSPRFVFLLGNLIIITLFAKSGKLKSQNLPESKSNNPVTDDLYQEFVEESERRNQGGSQMYIVENRGKQRKHKSPAVTKGFRRSQSENFHEMNVGVKSEKKLERSETERYIKWKKDEGCEKRCYPEDGMSSEEFRDAIEAFIARQKKFRTHEDDGHFY